MADPAPAPVEAPVVRLARPDDLPALEALLARCSEETRYRRFHGATGTTARRELERIAHPTPRHRSWVVVADGDLRGTATLAWGSDGVPEAAFLVEDAWFRRGLGRALFRAVAAASIAAEADHVVVAVHADNQRARRFLRAVAPGARTTFSGGGELEMSIPVPRRPCRSGAACPSEKVPA